MVTVQARRAERIVLIRWEYLGGQSTVIRFRCPICWKTVSAPDEKVGRMGKCVCGNRVRVPSPQRQADPVKPSAHTEPAPTVPSAERDASKELAHLLVQQRKRDRSPDDEPTTASRVEDHSRRGEEDERLKREEQRKKEEVRKREREPQSYSEQYAKIKLDEESQKRERQRKAKGVEQVVATGCGAFLVLLLGLCLLGLVVGPKSSSSSSEGSTYDDGAWRQRQAFEKFQRGERLTDLDVSDLAGRR